MTYHPIDLGTIMGVSLQVISDDREFTKMSYRVIIQSSKFGVMELERYGNLADAEKKFNEILEVSGMPK